MLSTNANDGTNVSLKESLLEQRLDVGVTGLIETLRCVLHNDEDAVCSQLHTMMMQQCSTYSTFSNLS